jgi:acyl-CoA thioester hydrolase
MARLQLDLPNKFLFQTEIAVRVTDLNYGGHVGNDSVLSIIHEARMQFIRKLGFASEVKIDEQIGIIVADAALVYKTETFYGDVLKISVAVNDINKYGFDFVYLIQKADNGKEVARAKTGIVCVDYVKKKVCQVPQVLLDKINP